MKTHLELHKKFAWIAVLTLGLGTSLRAHAEDACIAETDVARINAAFTIRVEEGDALKRCEATSSSYRVLRDLLFMEGLKFSGAPPASPWNQQILPENWFGYARELSPNILHARWNDSNPSHCEDNPGVAAYVSSIHPKTMFLCPVRLEPIGDEPSLVEDIETMLHESRHHEGDGFSHEKCKTGEMKNLDACDSSIAYKGSYAVTVETYSKLAVNAVNLHPAAVDLSRYFAMTYALRRFNSGFFDSRTAVILKPKGEEPLVYDGQTAAVVSSLPEGIVMPRREAEFAVRPKDPKASLIGIHTYDWKKQTSQALTDVYSTAFEKWKPERRETVTDILYDTELSPAYSGIVIGTRVVLNFFDQGVTTNYDFNFEDGRIVRLFTATDFNASKKNRVYLMTDDDEVYRVELLPGEEVKVSAIENPIKGFRMLSKIGKEDFLLDENGYLYSRIGDTKPAKVIGYESTQFEWMSRPFVLYSGTPFQ